jgi:hypothetical protein
VFVQQFSSSTDAPVDVWVGCDLAVEVAHDEVGKAACSAVLGAAGVDDASIAIAGAAYVPAVAIELSGTLARAR